MAADLAGSDEIKIEHLAEAIQYDKPQFYHIDHIDEGHIDHIERILYIDYQCFTNRPVCPMCARPMYLCGKNVRFFGNRAFWSALTFDF